MKSGNDRSQGDATPPSRSALQRRHRRLPLWVRLGLLFIGWVLLGIGILGLALPGIQGILTLLFAAAVLSAASETVYRLLRRLLERWPAVWSRIERFRERLHDRFSSRD